MGEKTDKKLYKWDGIAWGGASSGAGGVDSLYWANDSTLVVVINGAPQNKLQPQKPDDFAYFTEEGDCVDTSFVGAGGRTFTKYELKLLPQFAGYRIRVWGPDVWPLLSYDDGWAGTFFSWDKATGTLKIFWADFGDGPCGGQRQTQNLQRL